MQNQSRQLGNYRLVRHVGEGGFADVYLAEHTYLKTVAAVKILHTHLAEEKGARFYQEAQTIARLIHPHIVRVLDFGVDEGTPFLIMDYAPYGTLRRLFPPEKPSPLELFLPLVRQMAAALEYAHTARVVHCDLKPENVLLGRDRQLWLSDFGIAVVAHRTYSMTTQAVIGTATYMAPEQLRGKPRPASDQYALAVMVYEWLCGSPPFDGSSMEIAMQHMVVPPPPLHTFGADVSPQVEAVIMQALQKDPHQRFPNVQAFATALEEASKIPWTPAPRPTKPPIQASSEIPPGVPIDLIDTNVLSAVPPEKSRRPAPSAPPTADASTLPDYLPRRQTYPTHIVPNTSDTPPNQQQKKLLLILLAAALLLVMALSSLALLLPGSPLGNAAITTTSPDTNIHPSPGTDHTPIPGVTATVPPGTSPGVTPTPGGTPTGQPDPTVPTDPPVLEVSATSITFSLNLLTCNSNQKNIVLRNTGGGVVNWLATIEQPKYLQVNPGNGNIDAGGSSPMTVAVVCSALSVSVTDHIYLTWNNGQQITITVTINLL